MKTLYSSLLTAAITGTAVYFATTTVYSSYECLPPKVPCVKDIEEGGSVECSCQLFYCKGGSKPGICPLPKK